MKIYTFVSYEWDPDKQEYVEVDSNSYDYDGPVAQLSGGPSTIETRQRQEGTITDTTDQTRHTGTQEGATSTQSGVQETTPYSAQAPYLQDLFARAGQLAQGGTPDTTASGQITNDLISRYMTLANQPAPGSSATQGAIAGTNYLTNPDILSPDSNPALQQYISLANDAVTRSFAQDVLPRIRQEASLAGGAQGSRRGIAEGIAAQGVADALARQSAQMATSGYSQGLDALQRGVAMAPTVAGAARQEAQFSPQNVQNAAQFQLALEQLPFEQQIQLLSAYRGLIEGNFGGTTTTEATADTSGFRDVEQTTQGTNTRDLDVTTTGTQPAGRSGGLAGALGGLSAGAGVVEALGGFSSMGTPAGAAILGASALAGYL